jgi:hypothetical protein
MDHQKLQVTVKILSEEHAQQLGSLREQNTALQQEVSALKHRYGFCPSSCCICVLLFFLSHNMCTRACSLSEQECMHEEQVGLQAKLQAEMAELLADHQALQEEKTAIDSKHDLLQDESTKGAKRLQKTRKELEKANLKLHKMEHQLVKLRGKFQERSTQLTNRLSDEEVGRFLAIVNE